ncbi:hypothetical protein CPB86DRAFT_875672 [Serendipita vermifera]|nr:hypothetical protein CPB86DRAFT_875672 [Serendipita vermifera]
MGLSPDSMFKCLLNHPLRRLFWRKKDSNASDPSDVKAPWHVETPLGGSSSSVFALIIGIDQYVDPKYQLQGAVNDGRNMEEYLKSNLPSTKIRSLYDQHATRDSIIKEIRQVILNEDIRRQDPILIFYAGHGGEASPPANWSIQDQKIQVLIPQDYDEDSKVITDQGFAALLQELASAKGDNITVILDCCHSGSMTRNSPFDQIASRNRAIQITKPLSPDVDQDIFNARETSYKLPDRPFQYSGSASHVLLAACGESECALEEGGQGAFTRALLSTMREIGYKNMTYAEAIRRLPPLSAQSPRCEGKNRDRLFFSSMRPNRDRSWHEVHTEGNDLIIQAGMAHGITKDTKFVLSECRSQDGPTLGLFSVDKVLTFTSTISLSTPRLIKGPIYARPTVVTERLGVDSIHMTPEKGTSTHGSQLQQYSFVNREEASVEIDIDGDYMTFTNVDTRIQSLGYTGMPYRVSLREMDINRTVIQAANDFHRFLNLAGGDETLGKLVKMEYIRLERPPNTYFAPAVPAGNGEDLCRDSLVTVSAGDGLYGIRITNNSNIQLYPHLFLFDCSDLSIEIYYRPPVVNSEDKDAPLQPCGGLLTLGYGTGGVRAWRHSVREKEIYREGGVLQDAQDLDVNIFKLFLTSRPMDLTFMEQGSPFFGDNRVAKRMTSPKVDVWATVDILFQAAEWSFSTLYCVASLNI